MDAGNSSSQIVYFSGYEMEDQEAGIREMDAENDSGQLMNSSGHEMEDQEAERMKDGSQLHRKVKHYRKGCKDFFQPTLLRKVCLTIPYANTSHFTLSYINLSMRLLSFGFGIKM